MKMPITIAMAAMLAYALPVLADDAHHPEKAQEAKSAPVKPAPKTPEQNVRKMQDNLKKMQSQLDRIAKARTDEERQQALAEHMRTMHENMQMARGMQAEMMGCPMMEGGMMGGARPDGAAERMQQMERRMDMMQMMMEQMMRRQDGQPQPMPMK